MGGAFLGTVFILLPIAAIQVNEAWEWPRWQSAAGRVAGAGLMLAGFAVVAHCAGLFSRIGRGTPVPLEPPVHLVITGLYRYSRNPMYLAQLAILFGLFVYRGELSLLLHALLYTGVVQAWLVWCEEPGLRRRFGEEYVRFTREVPRWIRVRPRAAG